MRAAEIVSLDCCGGLIALRLRNHDGREVLVYGDSGPTGRALTAMFPSARLGGMVLDAGAIVGQTVEYQLDEHGLLARLSAPEPDQDHDGGAA